MSAYKANSLILASASPRRQELLEAAGLNFQIVPAHVNEAYREGETPGSHVKRLACDKAAAVAKKYPESWVLGADTIVVIDDMILGKPKSRMQAKRMLERLSGRFHKVFTGFAVVRAAAHIQKAKIIQTSVQFKKINPQEMEWYISCPEPYDKAGGYAAQGRGACFIKSLRGSYTNVIGLPVCEVMDELEQLGAIQLK
ncbi:MAG TPA: Maf family protein [Smithellaceae bacterium]|nr:Maf family protein [Smithellaceae bacterium]